MAIDSDSMMHWVIPAAMLGMGRQWLSFKCTKVYIKSAQAYSQLTRISGRASVYVATRQGT